MFYKLLALALTIMISSVSHGSTLFDLADYGKAGPQKKVFYKSDAFKGVSLTFDKNEVLPEHKVPFDALLVCIKGEAQYFSGKKVIVMKEGSFHKIEKGALHKIIANKKSQFILIR
ncbi:MAG: hypothetical protein KAG61_08475 [Bacteriovoracaceae bacterium]|nr:hypothetical protein [Bacteriovoracaceae bacterium]